MPGGKKTPRQQAIVAGSSDVDFLINEALFRAHNGGVIGENVEIHGQANDSCRTLENRISIQYLPNGCDKQHRFG